MPRLLNTERAYGVIAVALHWISAAVMIGMFNLGYWMVDLDYYSSWYNRAPDIHRSIGILFAIVFTAWLTLRILSHRPSPITGTGQWETCAARFVHWLFYILIPAILITGYLISTADGRSISVFGWFEVPATITWIPEQEDLAGQVHWYLALGTLSLAGLHALAALKHHFIDHDATLRRMLGRTQDNTR